MNRLALQQFTDERLRDAEALLATARWSAAYYLSGYAVECGLKSCIIQRVEADPGVIFQTRNFSSECWTHDLINLVRLASLDSTLSADCRANPLLETNWLTVKLWNESSRYQIIAEADARKMVLAVREPANGMIEWIRARW